MTFDQLINKNQYM